MNPLGVAASAPAPSPNGAVLTVDGARRGWAAAFRAQEIESPELDARILVAHALGLDHAALAAAPERVLDGEEERAIAALARRRLAREPVSRILGEKEFWSLKFQIDASTLVPRPETETLVETALAWINTRGGRSRPLRIADLGTGSGVILLALLSELPNAMGVGTDSNIAALAVARENARRLGLARARFLACDMASALGGPFDLIVSNPPYIASGDIAGLAPDVRDYDPPGALDGGPDGLRYYRAIAAVAPQLLAADGALIVELGAGQAPAVAAFCAAAGLAPSPPRADLNRVPRVLAATKRA